MTQLQSLLASASVLSLLSVADAWSPTNSYAPAKIDCNGRTGITREGGKISDAEASWLAKRDPVTSAALKTFLDRVTSNFADNSIVEQIFNKNAPKAGYAACGGGYRGMLLDAGTAAAMDDRTPGANEYGLGGLLQGITYITGVSGGAFYTSTVAYNNWTSVQDIIDQMNDGDHSIWDLSASPLNPGGSDNDYTNQIFADVTASIKAKSDAGFKVSLADAYGLITGYYMYPSLPEGGATYQWSDIQEVDAFKNGEMPMLMEVTAIVPPGEKTAGLDATTIELNPFEFGSWEPSINAFSDMKYLGTELSNGNPVNDGECVVGYDNVNFITSTSTDVINYISTQGNPVYTSMIAQFKNKFLGNITTDSVDTNIVSPNPFKGTSFYSSTEGNSLVETDELHLVDGGYGGQVIPLTPLMRKERDLDVVIATDNSYDTPEIWPNGHSIISTYTRQFHDIGSTDAFPYVPDTETFAALGLTETPTFFGCDSSNLTDLAYIPPLVVYLPNRMYSFASNISTYTFTYTKEERLAMIQNGFEIATRNNLTDDSEFASCIGCAVMRRKQEQLGLEWPSECDKCFQRYCWNGTLASDLTSISSSSNASTTTTTEDDASYTTELTTLTSGDNFSTIHFETSTTITCHECEEAQATATTEVCEECEEAQATTTVECEECEEGQAQATITTECEQCEEGHSNGHHYTTTTSMTTTTEICEECEEAKATATTTDSSNSDSSNSGSSNSGSSNSGSSNSGSSNSGSSNSGSSNGGSNKASSAPTILQVTTTLPTSSAFSIVLNENAGNTVGITTGLTLLAIVGAFFGLI